MADKLTKGQDHVMQLAATEPGGAIYKRQLPSMYWRNFDQLEVRGLLSRAQFGAWSLTEAGRRALSTGGDR